MIQETGFTGFNNSGFVFENLIMINKIFNAFSAPPSEGIKTTGFKKVSFTEGMVPKKPLLHSEKTKIKKQQKLQALQQTQTNINEQETMADKAFFQALELNQIMLALMDVFIVLTTINNQILNKDVPLAKLVNHTKVALTERKSKVQNILDVLLSDRSRKNYNPGIHTTNINKHLPNWKTKVCSVLPYADVNDCYSALTAKKASDLATWVAEYKKQEQDIDYEERVLESKIKNGLSSMSQGYTRISSAMSSIEAVSGKLADFGK